MNYQMLILTLALPSVLAVVPIPLEEDFGPPQPYTFGYKVHDRDGDQWRAEKSDGHGRVEGSYGYVDNIGMKREVHYVADDGGFRANIKTNEPGMDVPNPADVVLNANPPSDYDAHIYGIESIPRIPSGPSSLHQQFNDEVESKVVELPTKHDSKGFYKYHRFAEQSIPPIYVVDGHLQSPWFPMDSAQTV